MRMVHPALFDSEHGLSLIDIAGSRRLQNTMPL